MAEDRYIVECPRGAGGSPLGFALGQVLRDEARQAEIAQITAAKAPELLATFNRAWLYVQERVAMAEYELSQARGAVDMRKAVVMLDVVPQVLEQKKLAQNADLREAVVQTDPEYRALLDRVDKIKAVVEFLRVKAKGFENAFTATKRILQVEIMGRGPAPGGASPQEQARPVGADIGFGENSY